MAMSVTNQSSISSSEGIGRQPTHSLQVRQQNTRLQWMHLRWVVERPDAEVLWQSRPLAHSLRTRLGGEVGAAQPRATSSGPAMSSKSSRSSEVIVEMARAARVGEAIEMARAARVGRSSEVIVEMARAARVGEAIEMARAARVGEAIRVGVSINRALMTESSSGVIVEMGTRARATALDARSR